MVSPPPPAVHNLFRTALVIFVITVVIGVLNGVGIWDPPRAALLTHVHSGTLGWVALSVMGATLWMFGTSRAGSGRALAGYAVVAVPLYVLAFWVGTGIYRPIAGVLALIAFAWLLWWAIRAIPEGAMTVPKLALLLSLVSLFIGAVLGVLLGLQRAGVAVVGPEMGQRLFEAHPGTMVIGFVVLAGLGIAEWLLRQGKNRPMREEKAGVVQVNLFFLAGVVIIVGILSAQPELARVGGALQVAGLLVFLPRVARDLKPSGWSESIPGLLARLAVVGLVISVGLLVVLVVQATSDAEFTQIRRILVAYDHNNFLLVMTNIILGLMTAGLQIPPRRNAWIIAGVNLGAAGFVIALLTDSTVLKQVSTPVLGLALLWAIFTYVAAPPREQETTHAEVGEPGWKASS